MSRGLIIAVVSVLMLLQGAGCSRRPGPTDASLAGQANRMRQPPEPVSAYPKWEYGVFPINGRLDNPDDVDDLQNRLVALGGDGWELVCAVEGYGSTTALLFKRPVQGISGKQTRK